MLDGYDMALKDPGKVDTFVFGTSRFPAPFLSVSEASAARQVFAQQTPNGVLEIAAFGPTDDRVQDMLPAVGTLVATLEFTGPGPDGELPPGEAIEAQLSGPAEPLPADPADDGELADLGAPFSPVAPGRYELLNFGLPISVEVGDGWWVQPNFPGIVVLTHPDSFGPNDRDVVFFNSVSELVPVAGGPAAAGDPIGVSDIDALIESPPDGLAISDVERFDLEAPNGESVPVISFVATAEPGTQCTSDDPCEWALVTGYGFTKVLRAIDDQRIWWFPEHPFGPGVVVASAPATSDWITEAEGLMATLELSR